MENKLKTLYNELNERLSFLQGLELSDDVIAQRAEVTLCIVRVQQLLLEDLPSDSAITSESREADGGKLPIDSESGKEVSWQETAINFMEESGRLKAENEKLRELIELHDRIKVLNGYLRKDDDNVYTEDLIFIASKRISELRSLLSLDGSVDQPASREAIRDAH
jgi:hypothetical protein